MDGEIPGPSRPKKRFTDYERKRPLTLSEQEALINLSESDEELFVESESEYEPDETDSSEEEEDVEDVPAAETHTDQTNYTELPSWGDDSNFKDFPFLGNPGLKINLESDEPMDFFRLFLTDTLLENIVTETNSYAEELFLSKQTREKSRITDWKPITVTNLQVFLGLWLHMGNIKINRLQDYWKTEELYNLPTFRKYMSRNRFLTILRCLHLSKNPERGDLGFGDRLSKIRWLQDFFNKRMDEIYYPNKNLSLDESMVLWRGRLVFRQYIKNKKHKFGVKLYILSEPNGLVLKIRIYTGGEKDMQGEFGHSANVVMNLVKNYFENGHSLFMDNYYNSVALCKELI